METNTIERLEIERIAEQFRINEGFTEDANIAYVSGFDTGRKWQYDKLKEDLEKYKGVLQTVSFWFRNYEEGSAGKRLADEAKELLNNIKK